MKMKILSTNSNFTREPLAQPMGFKGAYLSELWQSVARISTSDYSGIGVGVQSILWSDSSVFMRTSQAAGNAYMFAMSDYALKLLEGMDFQDPFVMLDEIFPSVYEYGKRITNCSELRKTFALNSLVCVDNAAWHLYAQMHNEHDFMKLVPENLRPPLAGRQEKLCSIPLVTYGMDISEVRKLVLQGHFFLKIKIGSDPDKDGSYEKMLAWDKKRIFEIHEAVKDFKTPYTVSGHIPYYLDANGRYDSKERLMELLEYADKIGALERISILEEPFSEDFEEDVSNLPVRIAADESAHSDVDAIHRIEQGYGAIALKPIAKTMTMSLRVLNEAYKSGVPCVCADLTVNPFLVDFNKNVASRIDPLPGFNVGVIESNGPQNYANWERMKTYHPLFNKAGFITPENGMFEINDLFYQTSGGIFDQVPHYRNMVE